MYLKKIVFSPDFGGAMFWDENGIGTGDTERIWIAQEQNSDEYIDLSQIDGLEEWYMLWDKYATRKILEGRHVNEEILKKINRQGLNLSKQIESLLPDGIEFVFADELNNCKYLIENGRVEKLKDDE